MVSLFRDKLKLSEQERVVLSAAEFCARAPISAIAKESGYKETAVRYILDKLIDSGIILARRAYMNPYLIGFTNYTLYISLASWREKDRESLARFLTRSPRVTWFAEMGGDLQYAASVYATDVNEFMEFRDRISQQFATCIADQAV